MANSKGHLHQLALDLYELHDGNISEVARDKRMPSRITLIKWKKEGHPKIVTGGRDWDSYLDNKQEALVKSSNIRRAKEHNSFLDEAIDGIESVFRQVRDKIEAGDFEAKPADMEKMIKLYMQLDQRDVEKKNWMDGMMVHVLTIISEVVNLEQFTVIRTKFQDLERQETKKLDLVVDTGLPELPSYEDLQYDDLEVPEDVDFIETS